MSDAVKVGKKRGRKPADLNGCDVSGQDAVWIGVRALKTFTRKELIIWLYNHVSSQISDYTVNSYLVRLERGGFLAIVDKADATAGKKTYTYQLIKNCGHHAPKLKKDGSPSLQGRGRENLWRSMRILKQFDYRDLIRSSAVDGVDIKEGEAKSYVQYLHKAGYLKMVQAANGGHSLARYKLIPGMFTGPLPPQIQRIKQVYDPNIKTVMWCSAQAMEKAS